MLTRLTEYLDRNGVHYDVAAHPEAFTAQEVAATQHVPGRALAKVVMMRAGDGFVMGVLPATHRVDPERLARATGQADVRVATEDEFARLFPECERGAMPPFGTLWDIPVCVDESLTREKEIWFNAGTHHDTIHLSYADFARLVQPTVASFGRQTA